MAALVVSEWSDSFIPRFPLLRFAPHVNHFHHSAKDQRQRTARLVSCLRTARRAAAAKVVTHLSLKVRHSHQRMAILDKQSGDHASI